MVSDHGNAAASAAPACSPSLRCDFCHKCSPDVRRISDGTDSGESDYWCDACLSGDLDADDEPQCHDCGGDGWVDSVVELTQRYGWDDDAPGLCPNCRGSGLLKDCTTF